MASARSGSWSRSSDMGGLLGSLRVEGSVERAVRLLVGVDLAQTRDVAAAFERGLEPDAQPPDDLGVVAVGARPEREHVGVVVEAREPRRLLAGHDRGAD